MPNTNFIKVYMDFLSIHSFETVNMDAKLYQTKINFHANHLGCDQLMI